MKAERELQAVPGGRSPFRLESLIWLVRQPFSFEMAFVLFLFAAIYKTDPRFAWFPGDMTMVLFGLSLIAGFVVLWREGIYLPGLNAVCVGLALVLWIAASLFWSPSKVYAYEKLTESAAGILWGLIATAMIISNSRVRVWRFFSLLLIVGAAASLDHILAYAAATGYWRVENYLGLGRLAGLSALIAFVLWLQSSPFSIRGFALLAMFATCGYVLLIAGGRMPTAAVALSMLVPLLIGVRLLHGPLLVNRSLLLSLGLIAALALALAYLAMSGGDSLRTLRRFDILLTAESGGGSAAERFAFWRQSLSYWDERPLFGHGVGAFPVLYFGIDQRRYPHNIILELLTELGLVGLTLFVLLVIVLVRRVSIRRLREDAALMCSVMLCINTSANAMTTGDLADNRAFFIMLGLLAMRRRTKTVYAARESRSPHLGPPELRPASLHETILHARRGRA